MRNPTVGYPQSSHRAPEAVKPGAAPAGRRSERRRRALANRHEAALAALEQARARLEAVQAAMAELDAIEAEA